MKQESREYIINPYLSVKLEGEKVIVYVAGKPFRQCMRLLLDVPDRLVEIIDGRPESIDEASEMMARDSRTIIPPYVEFWGHCSNLQAWADYNYDTRLLHRNLAF